MQAIIAFDKQSNEYLIWNFAKSDIIANAPVVSGEPLRFPVVATTEVLTNALQNAFSGYADRELQYNRMFTRDGEQDRKTFFCGNRALQLSRIGNTVVARSLFPGDSSNWKIPYPLTSCDIGVVLNSFFADG